MKLKSLMWAGLIGLFSSLPIKGYGYDYCALPEGTSTEDEAFIGGDLDLKVLTFGDQSNQFNLDKSDVVDNSSKDSFNVTLIPVGYDDSSLVQERMEDMLWFLNTSYRGVNVSFSYVKESTPLDVYVLGELPILDKTQLRKVKKEVKSEINSDSLVFVLNTQEYLGLANKGNVVLSGEIFATPYMGVHEVGHVLGLGDGYERFYRESELKKGEIFTNPENLLPRVKKIVKKIDPPIVDTSNICNGEPVFSFYGPGDIMDTFYPREALEYLGNNGRVPFNPFQRDVMNEYIKRKIKHRVYR